MNYSEALEAVKAGKRVARKGWNGKGMFIFMTPASTVPFKRLKPHMQEHLIGLPNNKVHISAHIDMKAADDAIVIGWLASQTDMLANDWEIV